MKASLISIDNSTSKRLFALVLLLPLSVAAGVFISHRGAALVSSAISLAVGSLRGPFGLVTVGLTVILYLALIIVSMSMKPQYAVGLYILLLSPSYLFSRVSRITVNVAESGEGTSISLATFFLALLALVFHLRGFPLRKRVDSSLHGFERLLWLFAATGTLAQLVNHSLYNAVWLSLDGLWQFVLLFYIITSVANSINEIRFLIACMSGSMMLNVVLTVARLGMVGSYVDQRWGTRFFTVASSPGAVAAYGTVLFVLTLYLARSAKTSRRASIWLVVAGLLLVSVVLTQTRGAILVLGLLGLLLIWRSERRFIATVLGLFVLVALPIRQQIFGILTRRPLSPDLIAIDLISGRLIIWQASLPGILDNLVFGFGIAKNPHFYLAFGIWVNSHNLILYLLQDVGGIATAMFLGFLFYTLGKLIMVSFADSTFRGQGNICAYVAIALVMWFVFATTSSLSVTTHLPSGNHAEETILFYTVLYLGWASIRIWSERAVTASGEAG